MVTTSVNSSSHYSTRLFCLRLFFVGFCRIAAASASDFGTETMRSANSLNTANGADSGGGSPLFGVLMASSFLSVPADAGLSRLSCIVARQFFERDPLADHVGGNASAIVSSWKRVARRL